MLKNPELLIESISIIGIYIISELSSGSISFSAVPNLLPSGEVAIDTYTDHVGRTPFDEKIPMTRELISGIFDKGDDYILKYAVDSFTDY